MDEIKIRERQQIRQQKEKTRYRSLISNGLREIEVVPHGLEPWTP
jgi:hypothetical protein